MKNILYQLQSFLKDCHEAGQVKKYMSFVCGMRCFIQSFL